MIINWLIVSRALWRGQHYPFFLQTQGLSGLPKDPDIPVTLELGAWFLMFPADHWTQLFNINRLKYSRQEYIEIGF